MGYKIYVRFKTSWYHLATVRSKLIAEDIREMIDRDYELLEVKIEKEE